MEPTEPHDPVTPSSDPRDPRDHQSREEQLREEQLREEQLREEQDKNKKLFLIVFGIAAVLLLLAFLTFKAIADDDEEAVSTSTTAAISITTSSTTTSEVAGSVTTSPTTAPVSGTATNRCKASDLEASVREARPSEDNRSFTIALKSRATGGCVLEGFPAIALYNDTDVIPTRFAPNGTSQRKTLPAGQTTTFTLNYPASTDQTCPTATRIFITPPGDNQNIRLPLEGSAIARVCENTSGSVESFK